MRQSPDLDARSDAELLEAYRRGDARAFELLFDRHAPSVLAFAYRFCGNHELAEDVVQDCFRDLIDRVDRFELRGSLGSWFYVVAKRRALRLRNKRHRESADLELSSLAALSVDADGDEIECADLRRVLAQLPPAQQEVLALRYLDGFELEEIARALEIPTGTVKSRIHNALAQLRRDPLCRRYFDR